MTVGELRHSMTRQELLKWAAYLKWEQGEPDQNEMMNQLSTITSLKGGIQ